MSLDFSKFDYAYQVFAEMHHRARNSSGAQIYPDLDLPEDLTEVMGIASFCALKLLSLGDTKLRSLEAQGLIHSSTISGGSLDCALYALRTFFTEGKTEFEDDEIQQLVRTCQSAKKVFERGIHSRI